MTPAETAAFLRRYNEWRRDDEDISQFDVCKIGEAIDAAVEMIDRLEAAEADALEQARLNGMGSEREAALMAKLESAEKERTIDEQRIADLMAELNRVGQENEELHARIEAMEKQKPVCVTTKAHLAAMENEAVRYIVGRDPVFSTRGENDVPLYRASGAKGEIK